MISFHIDTKNQEVFDFLVEYTMKLGPAKRHLLTFRLLASSLLLAWIFIVVYQRSLSIANLLMIILLLALIISSKGLIKKVIWNEVDSLGRHEDMIPTYTIDEDGIHSHTEYRDDHSRWSHFTSWGIEGSILYMKSDSHTLLLCHKNQLSPENFIRLKALAGQHIANQE